jgi:alpha-L-fucosidase 2
MLDSAHPARRHGLTFDTVPNDVMSGLPLANGMLGGLVWSRDSDLIISLDRADLWDLRPIPEYSGPDYTNDRLADLIEQSDMAAIQKAFEAPYSRPSPTKLPGGRLWIGVKADVVCHLDVSTAKLQVGDVSAIVHALAPVGLLWGKGTSPSFELEPPAYGQPPPATRDFNPISPFGPEDLNYPLPLMIREAEASGYCQALPDDRFVCALAKSSEDSGSWRIAWTLQIGHTHAEALEKAHAQLSPWLGAEPGEAVDALTTGHTKWWEDYWNKAWLSIPDQALERQWVLDAYKLGAAARANCPPAALQAQWTTDNNRLPPWKGDYHHDLNTQMTYWPCLVGNRWEAHGGFLEWLWQTKPNCERWTKAFFEVDGLAVPMTGDIENNQLGGWAPYTHSATSSAWLAHHFVQHWRFSADHTFLTERAWPYVRACAVFIDQLTRKDAKDGRRALRLSSSPEINNNARDAWFSDWTNYDLALSRNLMAGAVELARAQGLETEVIYWSQVLSELPGLALDEDGGMSVAPSIALEQSHRHMSHLIAIHPLGQVSHDDPILAATIARLEALGTAMWMGYSFAWMASIYALAGRGDDAARMLGLFSHGFCAPNSFHTNGDISGEGLTQFPFNAFTLEGNCAAMAATQDMLLQSKNGDITLFPALPKDWTQARFHGLCGEGGIEVSAELINGQVSVTLNSTHTRVFKSRLGLEGQWQEVAMQAENPVHLVMAYPR